MKARFDANKGRHPSLVWARVQSRLESQPDKLRSLAEMERTGGEPDVVAGKSGEFVFMDCAPESPAGRRSVCYDRAGLESRKEHRPKTTALDLAAALIYGALVAAVPLSTQGQTAVSPTLESITLELGNGAKMDFVLIPAGTFMMGVENSKPDEQPVTKVTITRPFYFGKYEVTQEQWQAVTGSNPSYYKGTNLPVEQVSWNAAQGFLTNLNDRVQGCRFRLPTEAEWEYACRAGSTTQYSFGDGEAALPEFGWFTGNGERRTHPVGGKKPNPWGLYDIHGNVWEWCQDWYAPYPGGEVTDPTGPATGTTIVMRGGSWSHGARDLWSSFRFGRFKRDFPFRSIGLRVVAVPVVK